MRERSTMLASVTFAFVSIAGLMLQSTLSRGRRRMPRQTKLTGAARRALVLPDRSRKQPSVLAPRTGRTPRAVGRTSSAEECAANRETGRAGSRSTAARAGALAAPGDHRIVRCSCCKGRGRARAESCASGLPSAVPRYAENARPSALRAACPQPDPVRRHANRQRDRHGAGGGQFRAVKRQVNAPAPAPVAGAATASCRATFGSACTATDMEIDHTFAFLMIVFAVLAIAGPMLHFAERRRRRRIETAK